MDSILHQLSFFVWPQVEATQRKITDYLSLPREDDQARWASSDLSVFKKEEISVRP